MACLADGAWLVVHCGPMRSSGKMCDIPFEVKKILEGIDGVSLQDEIVCVPPLASGAMRFTSAFRYETLAETREIWPCFGHI